jgi:hypothetical protein
VVLVAQRRAVSAASVDAAFQVLVHAGCRQERKGLALAEQAWIGLDLPLQLVSGGIADQRIQRPGLGARLHVRKQLPQ